MKPIDITRCLLDGPVAETHEASVTAAPSILRGTPIVSLSIHQGCFGFEQTLSLERATQLASALTVACAAARSMGRGQPAQEEPDPEGLADETAGERLGRALRILAARQTADGIGNVVSITPGLEVREPSFSEFADAQLERAYTEALRR